MSTPPIDSVTGGSHGVVAGYDQMSALAATYAAESDSFVGLARLGPRVMADPDLLPPGRYPALDALSARLEALPEFHATYPAEYALPRTEA